MRFTCMCYMLESVYKIFYGGFIQHINISLGLKRINNNKVEKTFGQSSILVHRIEPLKTTLSS